MKSIKNYWLVGANWAGENQADMFYRRGYWEMGYDDDEKPILTKRRNKIKIGDRVAIKTMDGQGQSTITIKAIGIVKDVAERKIYIEWILKDLDRKVESKGAFATIHGPFNSSDIWINKIFCL